MPTISITRWSNGTYRPRETWEAELRELLEQDFERRGLSRLEYSEVIADIWWLGGGDVPLAQELWDNSLDAND
jgi:hypothetical protein